MDTNEKKQYAMAINAIHTLRERAVESQLGSDPKHSCLYDEFGYNLTLSFSNFYDKYRRQGIMGGTVDAMARKAFETNPWIIEGEESDDNTAQSTVEKEFKKFAKATNFWGVYMDATIRRSVGNYSMMIMQIADDKDWSEPAENVKPEDIVKFIPVWENQMTVSEWDNNLKSRDYSEPVLYSYQEIDLNAVTNNNPATTTSLTVHASRVIYFGDIYQTGSAPVLGNLMMQKGYNDGVTLEKLIGAGGEGAYKNSARHIATSFDKDTNLGDIAKALGVELKDLGDVLNEMTTDLNSNFDAGIFAKAATYTILSTTLPDMRETFDNAMMSWAASFSLPSTFITGFQTGERASSEDNDNVALRITSYRNTTLDNEIYKILKAFAKIGMWEGVDWHVMWDSLLEPSIGEKLINANLMADVNQKLLAQGQPHFTLGEIRTIAGLEAEIKLSAAEKDIADKGKVMDDLPEDK